LPSLAERHPSFGHLVRSSRRGWYLHPDRRVDDSGTDRLVWILSPAAAHPSATAFANSRAHPPWSITSAKPLNLCAWERVRIAVARKCAVQQQLTNAPRFAEQGADSASGVALPARHWSARKRNNALRDCHVDLSGTYPFRRRGTDLGERDRGFESGLLQRRVNNEPRGCWKQRRARTVARTESGGFLLMGPPAFAERRGRPRQQK
jgi:hypothetical protein